MNRVPADNNACVNLQRQNVFGCKVSQTVILKYICLCHEYNYSMYTFDLSYIL